jgi:hypothetical protein
MDFPTDPHADRIAAFEVAHRLNNPAVEAYFTRNTHRIAATRALLDLLEIPAPEWAHRKASGQAAITKAAVARFKADNPQERVPRGYTPDPRR